MRFVIADDAMRIRAILREAIERDDKHIVLAAATNGADAVKFCATFKPDVVILDISMPEMTGDLAARQIIEAGTATHVIMASSAKQANIVDPLIAIGAHFVKKPYKKEQIAREIEALVHGTHR